HLGADRRAKAGRGPRLRPHATDHPLQGHGHGGCVGPIPVQTIEKSTTGGRSEPPADRSSGVQRGDRIFAGLTTGVSVAILALLVVMMLFLFGKAWPALHQAGFKFFTERQWFPDAPKPRFGVEALVWGTVVSSVLSLLIAVPVAVASALYVTEYARPLVGRWVGYLVDVLAAVPSVVYGLWGLYFLVPR